MLPETRELWAGLEELWAGLEEVSSTRSSITPPSFVLMGNFSLSEGPHVSVFPHDAHSPEAKTIRAKLAHICRKRNKPSED